MPRQSNQRKAPPRKASDAGTHLLTSGDLARLLHVDLKTIHNWVGQGHLTGRRTKGRHLRFERTELVRFMRSYGYPVPKLVGAPPPRVVLDQADGSSLGSSRGLRRGLSVTLQRGLFACGLAVAGGDQEMVVIDLDRREKKQLEQFVAAVREWPPSQGLLLVGISGRAAARSSFLAAGGDAVLPAGRESDVRELALWLTGSSDVSPDAAELSSEQRPG